jgi:hypothetical protein
MKKFLTSSIIAFLGAISLYAQGSGTPSTLRVLTDANGYLVLVNATQTLPLNNPTVFSNTRLKTDASGYLQVVMTGTITPTFPLLAPGEASCAIVDYSFTGRTTTGLNSHAANTWNLCGGGTLGLSGNTTAVTTPLTFTATGAIESTGGNIYSSGGNLIVRNAGTIGFFSQGLIGSSSNGVFYLANSAGNDFGRLQLGGNTSSFPAIKRNATAINFRLADDSGDAPISAARIFVGDGTNVLPSISFTSNTAKGFFLSAAGAVALSSATRLALGADDISFGTSDTNQLENISFDGGTSIKRLDATQATLKVFQDATKFASMGLGGFVSAGASPSVSNTTANSCGTTAATLAGNSNNGVITVGATAGTSCTITFTTAAPTRRECTANNETTGNLTRAIYLTTTTTKIDGTMVAGDLISYVCFAR